MALILNINSNQPQIHAFIIGIGAYPYLAGGNRAIAQTQLGLDELRQLTSPPISAVAFYETLRELDNGGNLELPLGSIEFFASEIPASGTIPAELVSGEPNRANLCTAYDEWLTRCKTNSDNVAIFYFCGHGVEDGYHFLLTSDFGARANAPFDGSFNFDKTRIAVNQAGIKYQLFFVDACRDILPGMLTHRVTSPELSPPDSTLKNCKYYLSLKGAAPNEGAFAVPDHISVFTKSLITALKGAVSKKKNGKWIVTTARLIDTMSELMEGEIEGQGDPQRCIKETDLSFTLTTWDQPTNRKLEIGCNPDAALLTADLFCKQTDGLRNETRGPGADHWQLEIPAGFYEIKASFAANDFNNDNARHINVEDPYTLEILCC